MTSPRDSFSIVIPAFNEELRIPDSIRRIQGYFKEKKEEFEIIVVDDGSGDGTFHTVQDLGEELGNIKVLANTVNRGKGFSVRKGILSSSGTIVIISDADLSTPIEEMEKLLPYCRDGFEVVIGSRGLKESDIIQRQPCYREAMGKTFNFIVRSIVLNKFKDTQCGFKMFRADAAKRIFGICRVDGFSFDVEALFIAQKMGYRVKEVPIRWINSPYSRVRILRDSFGMLFDIFVIRLNLMRGFYNMEKGSEESNLPMNPARNDPR